MVYTFRGTYCSVHCTIFQYFPNCILPETASTFQSTNSLKSFNNSKILT